MRKSFSLLQKTTLYKVLTWQTHEITMTNLKTLLAINLPYMMLYLFFLHNSDNSSYFRQIDYMLQFGGNFDERNYDNYVLCFKIIQGLATVAKFAYVIY